LGRLAPTLDRCSPNNGGCNLIIPYGINVTRNHNQSTINAVNVYIYGFFQISSSDSYFYLYPMNFFIYKGGIFQDSTKNGFHFYINTNITIYPGGLFITQGPSYIYSYIQKNTTISSIQLNNVNIYGPYTIVIDKNGMIYNNGMIKRKQSIASLTSFTFLF